MTNDVYVCPEEKLVGDSADVRSKREARSVAGPMLRNKDGSVMQLVPGCRHVLEHGFSNIQGQLMDAFTASAIVQVFDALSPENQAKFEERARKVPPAAMADIVWKLIKKSRERTSCS